MTGTQQMIVWILGLTYALILLGGMVANHRRRIDGEIGEIPHKGVDLSTPRLKTVFEEDHR